MSSFFAEFPVSNILRAEDLFNTALDWMSGIKGSGFYGDEKLRDIKFPDSRLFLLGAPGEEVNFDNISGDDETGFGFRHQISDNEGREWLTECVLHRSAQDNFLTVRVYCLQNKFGAVVGLCCTNRVRDSSRESRVVAGMHEQTHTPDLQDQELASLQ